MLPCAQVKYIVACVAASEYLGSETKFEDWSYSQWDISALFGAVPLNHKSMKKGKVNGMPPQVFNKVTQVCAVCAVSAAQAAGHPVAFGVYKDGCPA